MQYCLGISIDDKFIKYAKVQKEHDDLKTRILQANKINILRLKTNESNEMVKIVSYL